jgi:hypothetical protein
MKNLKYCCEKFEGCYYSYKYPRRPNIRIVKYTSEFLLNSSLATGKFKSPYSFYITFSFDKFEMDMPYLNISYCPFCGKDLYKFYKSDEYANEVEGVTFPFVK